MYEKVGEISKECQAELLVLPPLNTHGAIDGPCFYQTTDHFVLEADLPLPARESWLTAFYVVIPPNGHLHPHSHGDAHKILRWHIVLQTNAACECWNAGKPYFLEELGIYSMEPDHEHEAWNRGETERIHLILETKT